jgi:hypothetical protein
MAEKEIARDIFEKFKEGKKKNKKSFRRERKCLIYKIKQYYASVGA